jgi:hypothetical protein
MAELNFNALVPAGPRGFIQGLEQGQAQQQANALTMQKAAQEQEMNALRMQQTRGTISQQQEDRQKRLRVEKTGAFRERLLRAPTPEAAREIVKMQYADPDIGPVLAQGGTLEQSLAEVSDDPTMFERYKQQEAMGMSEWMKSQMPKVVGNAVYKPTTDSFVTAPTTPRELTPPASVAEYNLAKNDPNFMRFLQDRASVTRAPSGGGGGGAPAQKAPSGYRHTPTGDLEPIPGGPVSPGLSPKDIQKREATYPQATSSVKSFESKSEQYIKELEKLRDDPGLNQITGPVYGRTPSVSRAGSRAQSLYDKIFAKGGFQALQDMREASKTGGALGNVSNAEGVRLERSTVGGLDRTQNIKDVQQGINDLIEEIRGSQARVREAYDLTYDYKKPAGASGGVDTSNPLLKP